MKRGRTIKQHPLIGKAVSLIQPIGVVQIKRNKRWADALWILPDSGFNQECKLALGIGEVTAVRIKYLKEVRREK